MAVLPNMKVNIMADILSRHPFASGLEKTEGSQNAVVQTSAVQTPKVKTAGPDPTSMATRVISAGTLYMDHLSIGMDTSYYEDDIWTAMRKAKLKKRKKII